MKWKTTPYPKDGQQRIQRIFAFLPKKSNDGNTYWLQYLYVLDEFSCSIYDDEWCQLCCYPNLEDVKNYPTRKL